HNRREEVIQHVYAKYGREHAAMVAEVIRYRHKSALRDVGKTLGISDQSLLQTTRFLSHGWRLNPNIKIEAARVAGFDFNDHVWLQLLELSELLLGFPRHLSIHVGGFVLSDIPLANIVPIENARMPNRTVIQWDKYDIEALRIFKVDLLGLGMLNVIARAFRLITKHAGKQITLATVPPDDAATYRMIQRADTIGVFQIESRGQMSMLPRLRPQNFYDLVIEVSLIRPGPIQGGMVHPYLRRRRGKEKVDYPHPKLRPILERTLGVPIFQEQVMRMAVEVGGYTPGQADQLRRDMGVWKQNGDMVHHQRQLYKGMRKNGIDKEFAKRIIQQIQGFGSYGFPESHAAAFAHLVYVSAYLKCHYPVEFAAALINAQPMGFYQVATIVSDLHHHGAKIFGVDVQYSQSEATVENGGLRMGFCAVRNFGKNPVQKILASREQHGSFRSISDLARRCELNRSQLTALAMAGAFCSLAASRRDAIWQASGLGGNDLVANLEQPDEDVRFAPLSEAEEMHLNYLYADSFLEQHPLKLLRPALNKQGVLRKTDLIAAKANSQVKVAGLVIVRQRPTGPGGVIFMTLEDETGLFDVVVRSELYEKNRALLRFVEILLVQGRLQADGQARSVLAQFFHNLTAEDVTGIKSRDFR
ncbi:MAG: OB-fold nucleic acid binding domain-containing protein, partial [Pseudomonadota bacterium]